MTENTLNKFRKSAISEYAKSIREKYSEVANELGFDYSDAYSVGYDIESIDELEEFQSFEKTFIIEKSDFEMVKKLIDVNKLNDYLLLDTSIDLFLDAGNIYLHFYLPAKNDLNIDDLCITMKQISGLGSYIKVTFENYEEKEGK